MAQKKEYFRAYGLKSRSNNTSTVKESVLDMLDSYKLKTRFNETKIINAWPEIMGKGIENRTKRVFFKNRTMFVELNSAALKNELSNNKAKVLERMWENFPKENIEDVIFL